MQNQQYLEVLETLGNRYKNSSMQSTSKAERNKISIREEDLKKLSRFELNTIKHIGAMFGIFARNGDDINYADLIDIVNKLTKHKTDPEKVYLLGLFFPEKLKNKNIHHINPFP